MALALLKSLTTRELAELASLDRGFEQPVPLAQAQADWLMERETPATDVCLMFGQGIAIGGEIKVPPGSPSLPAPDPQDRGGERCAEQHNTDVWHLPQATFATWAGCVFGAERQQQVAAWRILRGQNGCWVSCSHQGWNEDLPVMRWEAVLREMRRRVLRRFPEVTRTLEKAIDLAEFVIDCPATSRQAMLHHRLVLQKHDFQFGPGKPIVSVKKPRDGKRVCNQTLGAEEFVPPEPRYRAGELWMPVESMNIDWENTLADNIRGAFPAADNILGHTSR